MFLFIIKNITISILLILLVHFSYNYLKRNFTTPKIKDLVIKPQKQYNKLYEFIEKNESNDDNNMNAQKNDNNDNNDVMENELKKYIEEINNDSNDLNEDQTSVLNAL
jgi:hypothetical protein